MTQSEFIALGERVSFGGGVLFWMPTIKIKPEVGGGCSVHVERHVIKRELRGVVIAGANVDELLPKVASLEGVAFITARVLARSTEAVAIKRLLWIVRDLLVHEIDESIRFDGALANDPHAGESAGKGDSDGTA